MGRRHRGHDIHGILLLNKPQGITSNDALQKVKRLFNANKAGHTGALDPLATGMLPICLGEATKFSQLLLDADKRYRVIARLGQRTNTSDADGQIIMQRQININQQQLNVALSQFLGTTDQIPSMYSALKYQGRPLYEYARQGIEVPRTARKITVFLLNLIRWQDDELELEILCSKGTYIRTIIDDLGEILGCGAHVIALHRLQVATYHQQSMVTLEQLEEKRRMADSEGVSPHLLLQSWLMPIDSAVQHFPEVNLISMVAGYLKQGQSVRVPDAPSEGWVRITEGENREFIGVGMIDNDGCVAPRRLMQTSLG